MEKQIKITTIGWGAWSFNVLYGLKNHAEYALNSVIWMCDNGGTAGAIRDKYGILPPWDTRRAIAALAKNTWMVRKLFEYKFDESGVIWGNKIGNILLTALTDITGSSEAGIDALAEMFDAQGKVIPVTLEDVHLWVRFDDGVEVIGEKNIDISDTNPWERSHNPDAKITDAFLVWGKWVLNPRAKEVIMNSDYIILWPWDLYTSIIPNLLSEGMKEALLETPAKIIYMCNIMTKRWETSHMEVTDFVDVIEKYVWERNIDYVVVNNGFISEEVVERYKQTEGKKPVKVKDKTLLEWRVFSLIEADLVDEADVVRHNPQKVEEVIRKIVGL